MRIIDSLVVKLFHDTREKSIMKGSEKSFFVVHIHIDADSD